MTGLHVVVVVGFALAAIITWPMWATLYIFIAAIIAGIS